MPIVNLDRTIFSLHGENVHDFLDPLITNSCTPKDLEKGLVFAALLTPQGKIIADFFVHAALDAAAAAPDQIYIECPQKFASVLHTRLKMYKLRAKIDIIDISDACSVYAVWDGLGDIGHPDPRHPKLGSRLLSKADQLKPENTIDDYDAHRLALGVPESHWDFETISMFPADANMDLLSGVDYQKGCFIGQEVVSRMHRKSEVRKRMCKLSGVMKAEAGDSIVSGTAKIGIFHHSARENGIGLIRLDRLAKTSAPITLSDNPITITPP